MSFEPRDYLRHVLVEVDYLLDQSQTLTYVEPPRGLHDQHQLRSLAMSPRARP